MIGVEVAWDFCAVEPACANNQHLLSVSGHGSRLYGRGARNSGLLRSGSLLREATGISLPNNQRQHRSSHAPKDVLPLRICADCCSSYQPLLRAFSGWIRYPPPTFEGDSPLRWGTFDEAGPKLSMFGMAALLARPIDQIPAVLSGVSHPSWRDGASDSKIDGCVQGNLAQKKTPPPQDHCRALDIVLLFREGGYLFARHPCTTPSTSSGVTTSVQESDCRVVNKVLTRAAGDAISLSHQVTRL